MEFTNEEMVKSLTSLIDETLEEIEEIKKSKFAASEISLGDSEAGMAGKSKNGELDAKKKEDEDKDEDKEDKEDMAKMEDDVDKGENEKADSDQGKFAQAPSVSKGENEKADPDHGKFAQAPSVSKKEDKDEDEDKDKDVDYKDMKKSLDESETMIKSYVDGRMSSIEDKLSKMAAAIEAFADAPAERKSVPAGVAPLHKSTEEVEPLDKSEVASKLFELKKSGEAVDSTDIFMVETGNQVTAQEIATKYGLK
jgi:hypothetical protein